MQIKESFGFSRRLRVRKKEDFQKIYRTGGRQVDFAGVIYFFPAGGAVTRIGVAAGKKLGTAVERNYMKRQMREVFRQQKSRLKPGFDLLWIARRPLKNAGRVVFEQCFARLCHKAKLLVKA